MTGRDQIADLVHRYSDAVVHRNLEQWSSTWAPNGVWDLGKGRRVEGLDAMRDAWTAAMDRFAAVVQTIVNGTAELDDTMGVGVGRWYVHEILLRADDSRDLMIGHYDDRYVRIDDDWRFAQRELVVHYQGPPDLSGTFNRAGDL